MKGNTKFFNALYASNHQVNNTVLELVHPTLLENDFRLEQSHDQFLADLEQVIPDDPTNPYDVSQYPRMAMNMKKSITPKMKKTHKIDPKAIQPCLAFLPLETITSTFPMISFFLSISNLNK